MQHYFLKDLKNNIAYFEEEDLHHLFHVMRLKNKDNVVGIFDNKKYLLELDSINLIATVVKEIDSCNNTLDITLIHGMPKGDKFELALQKTTELGVKMIVPFMSERSVIRLDEKDKIRKLERFNKIVKEASEQSERLQKPIVVKPIEQNDLSNYLSEINIVCDENLARSKGLSLFNYVSENKNKSVSILIGPEGGFSKEEFEYFHSLGFVSCSLGNSILRSETAAIAAVSIIGAIKNDI